MPILVRHLPNPRTAKPRDVEYVLSKAGEVGQHPRELLPLGGGLLVDEHLHHNLVVVVPHDNPPDTLWVSRTNDYADRLLVSVSWGGR
jgi:hypothetical protein